MAHIYGPIEYSVIAFIWTSMFDTITMGSLEISMAANSGLLILRNYEELMPVAEFVVEGPVVAIGYLDLKETRESFID